MMPSLKILVVEDYEPFRRAICSSLREKDFLVMESADGLEAIEKAKKLQPDLVLFDIYLPKLNGIESAKHVRSLVPNAKVMFVTLNPVQKLYERPFDWGHLATFINNMPRQICFRRLRQFLTVNDS
jgi:CheY-like chemotaxis protein